MFERFRAKRTADESTTTTDREDAPGTAAYPRRDVVHERTVPLDVRGGLSFGAILTGVVVAFGAMSILVVVITGILVALGVQEGDISAGEALQAGIWTGVGLVVAQFLAYLWGGYTAGRMGRGAGVGNGLFVALAALVIGVAVGGIAVALGASLDLAERPFGANLPFDPQNLANDPDAQGWGIGLGIAMLVAMFLAAAIGGGLGARWHTKLERDQWEHGEGRDIDLRERRAATTSTNEPVSTSAGTSANRTTTQPPPPDRS